MDLVDLEFLELGCLAGKNWSGAVFVDLELRGALPNTPLLCPDPLWLTILHPSLQGIEYWGISLTSIMPILTRYGLI
jgi:hypothetical protein